MGYDLHFTRAAEWYESKSAPISVDEWTTAARDAAGLTETTELADGTGTPVFILGNDAREGPAFYWTDGRVVVRGADEGDVPACVELAHRLGANLLGDDGEMYS